MTFAFHLLIHIVCLTALAATARVFERAPGGLPEGWTFERKPDPSEPIRLRVALRQQNVEQFDQTVLAISTPGNPRYGKHLKSREIRAMLRPTEAVISTVVKWLDAAHIHEAREDDDWIHLQTNVSSANALLDTNFLWYRSPYEGRLFLRTLQYSVPKTVEQHINLIQPTTRFGSGRPLSTSVKNAGQINQFYNPLQNTSEVIAPTNGQLTNSSCVDTIYPSCLLQLYNVHYKPEVDNGNKVAYASFLEQFARDDDLTDFENRFVPWAEGQLFEKHAINGTTNDQDSKQASTEANLNAQYIRGVSAPIPMIEYSVPGRGPAVRVGATVTSLNEPYLDYLHALRDVPDEDLPQTISHSYGEDEQSVPETYARQVCQMFGELGARGVSVIFASGDTGVGSYCADRDDPTKLQFQAQFPAACPTVTSVGGTQGIPERAAPFSSGGFSRLFPRPTYQDLLVDEYLLHLYKNFAVWGEGPENPFHYFNISGRGFPDVSMQAYRFAVMDQNRLVALQGTSASAPAFAGIIALLNAARMSAGIKPLGFLNPWLYSFAVRRTFSDIKDSGSYGCDGWSAFHTEQDGSPVIPGAGWNATVGWDPVTGLGTPNFGKLLELAAPGTKNENGPLLPDGGAEPPNSTTNAVETIEVNNTRGRSSFANSSSSTTSEIEDNQSLGDEPIGRRGHPKVAEAPT